MKAEKIITSNFTPFNLNITIESEEEAKALFAIFNSTHNTKLLSQNVGDMIKDVIGSQFYVIKGKDIIANGITYNEFYGVK